MSFVINPYRFGGGGGPPPSALPEPLHWWDLDDVDTNLIDGLADLGNGTNDMSLTRLASPTNETGVAPDGGDACLFDGLGRLHATSDFTWDGDATQMSTQCWVYIDSVSTSNSYFMSWRDLSGDRLFDVLRRLSDTYIKTPVWDDTDSLTNNTDDAGLATSTGEWLHIVTTWAKNGDLKTYINGSIVSGATTSAGANDLEDTNTMSFAIGVTAQNTSSEANMYTGNAWAFGIWDEELTADQVSALYNGSSGGKFADYTWT